MSTKRICIKDWSHYCESPEIGTIFSCNPQNCGYTETLSQQYIAHPQRPAFEKAVEFIKQERKILKRSNRKRKGV